MIRSRCRIAALGLAAVTTVAPGALLAAGIDLNQMRPPILGSEG